MPEITFKNDIEITSPLWKQEMEQCGQALTEKRVRQTVIVHGTFVGGDPLGILGIIKSFGIPPQITHAIVEYGKKFIDMQIDDLGNFPDDYCAIFKQGLNNNITCRRFNWSSENNHIGRLREVPNLARDLAENIDKLDNLSANDRILLVGHSHAGQLFALLIIFLESSDKAKSLLEVLTGTENFDQQKFSADIQIISGVYLDIVTLGTPVRYPWGNYSKYRLLNFVNHRSDSKIDGVMTTRDGDYVQQWGTNGTDLPPLEKSLFAKNKKLDKLLDKGVSSIPGTVRLLFKLISKHAESKRRTPRKVNKDPAGNNIYINYEDNDSGPVETVFGHGAYTLRKNILFHTRTIVHSFYTNG